MPDGSEQFGAGVECGAFGVLVHEFAGIVAYQRVGRIERVAQWRRYIDGYVQSGLAAWEIAHEPAAQFLVLPAGHDVRFGAVRA